MNLQSRVNRLEKSLIESGETACNHPGLIVRTDDEPEITDPVQCEQCGGDRPLVIVHLTGVSTSN